MSSRNHLPILVYALLSLFWGSTWIAIKLGLSDMPPFTSSGIRLLAAAGILALYMKILRVPHPRDSRSHLILFGVGVLMFGLPYGLIYWGQQYIPAGMASVLFASLPFFVALEAHFLVPGERLTPTKVLGTLVGFFGIVVVFSDRISRDQGFALAGMLALILSALTSGFGNVLGKRTAGRFHPVVMNALPQFYGGVFLSILALIWERNLDLLWTPASVGSLIYLTLIGSCLVFVLYFWLLQQMETTTVALIALITPLTALGLGWIILGEKVTPRLAVGAALVAVGIALATLGPGRRRSSSSMRTSRC